MVPRGFKPLYMYNNVLFAPEDGLDYAKKVCLLVLYLTSVVQFA